MKYLKAFTIGSSGLVWFQYLALLSLRDKEYYDYSYKVYSIIIPIYFGLMSMLALYIRKLFNLSLEKSLFIISIISISFIVFLNYFVSRKKYKPYKNYTNKDWIRYILTNGARHMISFNLIIFYLTKYFSSNYWLRVFIIGSSFFSCIWSYLLVIWQDRQNKLGDFWNYKEFAVRESLTHGIGLLINLYILQNLLGFKLKDSLFISVFISSFNWFMLVYNLKAYKYDGLKWSFPLLRSMFFRFVKAIIVYYLLINLK